MGKLNDKVAIVTGASRGTGRACALMLAHEGATVVVNYHKSKIQADEVVNRINASSGTSLAWQANVSVAQEVNEMIRGTLDKFHRIDILVNNAAIQSTTPIESLTEDIWDLIIGVNLKGTYLCSKAVIPTMRQSGEGRIINISSIGGLRAVPHMPSYSASKSAVLGFTKALAAELTCGIMVNCIAPGGIDTDMQSGKSLSSTERMKTLTPLKRWAKPEEIADVVVFLATTSAPMTGQVIIVDGGLANQTGHSPTRNDPNSWSAIHSGLSKE